MRRTYLIVATLLFLSLILTAGCVDEWFSSKQTAKEGVKAVTKVQDSAQDYYDKLTGEGDKDAAAKETVDWLEKQDDIAEAGIGSGCIWYKLENGVTGLIQTDSMITE